MSMDSIWLAAVGAVIGVLTLTATAYASRSGGGRAASESPPQTAAVCAAPADDTRDDEVWGGQAAEAFAPEKWYAALRLDVEAGRPLSLCELDGNEIAPLEPDADGDVALGPIAPGRYALVSGTERLGSFRMYDNAALGEAAGRLWTDGEVLHLADYLPGQAEVSVTLPAAGYYSFALVDDNGLRRTSDLFIPSAARPDEGRSFLRTLEFYGLPEGRYTLVHQKLPLLQFRVLAGGVARVSAAVAANTVG